MEAHTYPLALCEFYKDGSCFPVRMGIRTMPEAEQARNWQRVGQGEFSDWRIVGADELKALLEADKVNLSAFTPEAQAAKREFILSKGKAGES